jgi:RHS repeat-associated protein
MDTESLRCRRAAPRALAAAIAASTTLAMKAALTTLAAFTGLAALTALGVPVAPPAFAATPAMCSPAGGAPGGSSSAGAPIGGAIGPGVGGTGVDAFASVLAGESLAPPASACAAPPPMADTFAPAAASGEPASIAAPGWGRAAGNPVDVVTGNKYHRQADVVLPHPESSALSPDGPAAAFGLARHDSLLLQFARHYNSRSDFALSLGRGWSHSFDTRLARIVRNGRVELQIVQADGRRLVFTRTAAGPYGSGRIADGLVDEQLADAAASFVWRWPGGRRVAFDADGRLASIVAADLDEIRLRRDSGGRLLEASDNAGRALGFEYAGSRLAALRLPDGQRIAYDYDAHGQLAAVRYPDGRTQRYHYEDPRAFHLLTGLTDTDGRRSRYAYDDSLRVSLSQGIGAGDAQSLRFAYRLPRRSGEPGTTTVSGDGRVSRFRWVERRDSGPMLIGSEGDGCAQCPPIGLRTVLGRDGRTVSIGAVTIRHDSLGRVVERRIGGAGSVPNRVERLGYADADPLSGPTRIERPSVVAGRTMRWTIAYAARGQVVAIDVAGFAPGGDAPESVAASLRFQYAQAGPAIGKLLSIAREGGSAGVARTVFVHDAQRRLVRIGHAAVLAHTIERDAIGRARSERLPDGSRRTRAFDRAWRLASSSVRGVGVRIDYDDAGRPSGVEWSTGERWTLRLRGDGVEIDSNHGWRRVFPQAARRAATAPGPTQGGAEGQSLPVALARAEPGRRQVVDAAGQSTEFLYDDLGRLVETRSSHAGSQRQRYDALGRLARIEHADGSVDVRHHDLAGRIVRREQVAGDERVATRFGYEGARLVSIDHPVQRSLARHDALGRLVELVHERDGATYRQTFSYDPLGRLAGQGLPDGSRLVHGYDAQGRADAFGLSMAGDAAVRWLARFAHRDADATVIDLGNGIRFEQQTDASGRPSSLRWLRGGTFTGAEGLARAPRDWDSLGPSDLPFRRLQWHPRGLPIAIAHESGEDRYGYDRLGRLIARERHAGDAAPAHVEYFLHGAVGGRIAARRRDGTDWREPDAKPDASGRPTRHRGYAVRYGAQRRIVEAEGERGATRYRYDAFGVRAARSGAAGDRGFLHHAGALVAETGADGRVLRQYLRWNGRLVAVLDHEPVSGGSQAGRPSLHWIHADHLGTPIAATDERGRVAWRGDWDAFGGLARAQGGFVQPLRLDGQYFDPETRLHDNVLRTYDPDAGRYLEPDPLGLAAGLDPFAYVDGNPLVATDPLGLILFAFDGTGNGATALNGEDVSNVRKFFEQYEDPAKWYMAGVGRDDLDSGIAGGALDWAQAGTARARVDWMLGTLDGFLGDAWIGKTAPIDVIGFSRGAAMARDFVNRVSTLIDERHFWARGICVDLRFLGLWDTVAQFGLLGADNESWQLSIPSAVRATFHAVALNEHRALFPLESALGGSAWVVERGFIGDHSDVGGGNAEGDLSDVSLVWMTQMAKAMGLPMRDLHPRDRYVTDPRVHNRNYSALGDRYVYQRDAGGRIVRRSMQRRASIGGMSWRDTAAFFVPYSRRGIDGSGQPSIVGTVDLRAYAAWLKASYGIEIGY